MSRDFDRDAPRQVVPIALLVTALALSACFGVQSALDVRGPGAARIAELWWLMFGVATAVYLVVIVLLLFIVFRRRHEPDADTAERRGTRWIIVGGVVLPAVVLTAVFVIALRVLASLNPSAEPADLAIRITGRQWWWEITYLGRTPSDVVTTANEIHIPTGRRVRLEITSADVIHSLWVTNLQGKTDLIPGKTNVTWLEADRPGVSRGQCAEYCGIQHARMALMVIAEPPAQFERWLAEQRRPAAEPTDVLSRRGQGVFANWACAYCHAVRGTGTLGRLGPDLTHLASRRTIAAGTLPNTRGNLAGWIVDPQRIKFGARMPRSELDPRDLQALLHYLESLR